jgi:hypothetical protein
MGITGRLAFWRRKPATIEVIRGVDGKVKMLVPCTGTRLLPPVALARLLQDLSDMAAKDGVRLSKPRIRLRERDGHIAVWEASARVA